MTANNLLFSLIFILPFLISMSLADDTLTSPVSSGTICKSTPDPSYCKSVLPNNHTANVYDYGRFSVEKSLSQSHKFLKLVDKYLKRYSPSLSRTAILALKDCYSLAELNIDFLSSSFDTVNNTNETLSSSKAEDIQTLLSAILTNQETCLDGLKDTASAWSVKNGLSVPLSNDTKLYSVSLALFTKGWVPSKKNGKPWHPKKKHISKSLIYESLGRRKLTQIGKDEAVAVRGMVVVSKNGSGNFTTINDAISAAPNNSAASDGYFLIYVTAGVYQEYLSIAINKPFLLMIGDGIDQTIITGNRSVVDGWTTMTSATFSVRGPGFMAMNITFRNTAGAIKQQAVAVLNMADLSTFYSCSFEGYQDTLFAHSLRQFYRDCDIYGTVDFIFGNAAAVFQNNNFYARLPSKGQFNPITAQGRTDPNQNTGISIQNCTIRAADDLASSNFVVKTYLGRPWKQYSRTVYVQSFMDSLVDPAGWHDWNGDFGLGTLYYAEYDNRGPGSNTTTRVTWPGYHVINATDATNFTVSNFLLGDHWLPQTGVPYTAGLI
uniref:Pectinesterase n=1 Tax=Fagus sylvatica TaxID=28930 RepID=A0A2N9FL11_FAGSY